MQFTGMVQYGQEYEYHSRGQAWISSWHPASAPPPVGKNHGSGGVCFTPEGKIVIVTEDGSSWVLPAGRPEPGESLRDTLVREIMEEACASVEQATLLGYARGVCIQGREKGLVLVRSYWHATVTVHDWLPRFEMVDRLVLTPEEAVLQFDPNEAKDPVFLRYFYEALLIQQEGFRS